MMMKKMRGKCEGKVGGCDGGVWVFGCRSLKCKMVVRREVLID